MDLQSRKLAFVQQFMQLESEEIIRRLENFLEIKLAQSHDYESNPKTIKTFNANMEMTFDDIAHNRTISDK